MWTSNLQAVRFKTWLLVCREAQSLQTGIPQAASFSVLLDFFRSARFADWWSEAWQLHTNKGACSDLNEVLAIFLRRLFNYNVHRVVLKIEGFQHGMQEKLKSTYMANAVRARGAKCRHAVEKRRGECCACTRS